MTDYDSDVCDVIIRITLDYPEAIGTFNEDGRFLPYEIKRCSWKFTKILIRGVQRLSIPIYYENIYQIFVMDK